jgi:hypothetical protein
VISTHIEVVAPQDLPADDGHVDIRLYGSRQFAGFQAFVARIRNVCRFRNVKAKLAADMFTAVPA